MYQKKTNSYMRTLLENKNHLIDKLTNLTDAQKEEIKAFFLKHPSYESKIDWNNKSLSYNDFKPILALDGKSKTQAKKKGIEGITENVDYKYLGDGYSKAIGNYKLYQPLTYLGSVTLASNKVPPVKGNGAQWCIAYQKTSRYWDQYTWKDVRFVFVLTADTKYAITIYSEDLGDKVEVYSFDDKNLEIPDWMYSGDPSLMEILAPRYSPKVQLAEFVKKGLLEDNGDGTYSKTKDNELLISDVILGGRFICKLSYWNGSVYIPSYKTIKSLEGCPQIVRGNFDCSGHDLESLEGGPREVTGNYTCQDNRLTTLKGGPEKVGYGFYCSNNRLTTLEGGPRDVGGSYDCKGNQLIDLKGAPEEVNRDFICSDNHLRSLEGAPRTVEDSFNCMYNELRTLKGGPESVGKRYLCSYNALKNLEGIAQKLGPTVICNENPLKSLNGLPEGYEKNWVVS